MNINRDFSTGTLPIGNYIIDLQLIYPNGVAPSSAYFEVIPMDVRSFIGTLLFFIVLGILMISIFIVIILIKRRKEKEESN
jgi:subtilase family serine protease